MRIAYGTYIPQLHPSIYMAIGAKLIGDVKFAQHRQRNINRNGRHSVNRAEIGEYALVGAG